MSQTQLLGYIPKKTVIHQLSGASKLLALVFLSVATMTTYDTRFLLAMSLLSIVLFRLSHIKWQEISFVVKFVAVFSLLNLIAVYLFSPEYGVSVYGTRHVIWEGVGRFTLTQEQLFYEFNLLLKYIASIPIALIFILTTNPSEFAASLNKIGVSYKISYAVALALRYIPDVQRDFFDISMAQQARGIELSRKAPFRARAKGTVAIVFPLVLSSIERIDVISTAMELRRFGRHKNRTWYSAQTYRFHDYFVIGVSLVLLIISFSLFKVNQGRFYNPF
ncbi:energy-coupling factor transporter transmembrane protein EcfT [Vagococcus lutrae]|uniref:Energy-coupling factor transporter transmembrane component T n=1 Tax=Vagococcus lutrae TaxID=81947 RepID=A0AAE9XN41_9ENTE|nr:energy-coupling factor transporter transmembrane component T [Vagococcus lutrae]MDO5742328.1 energy-coupling factor transporter transmembrane component T [Vagococcus sp.]MCO7151784.1 energy-coupling factor transporter transmembrane protein EcfT [Vagococcus lutrae]MDT2801518.1 energy-coupling factor transporter transmembrane component T [Vagococcus lutrae]MDT2812530.1 energy-coupling factor transporter transmembrane component T [Vagococcus lutrae]MDT2819953.1 energy-coupling factor transport